MRWLVDAEGILIGRKHLSSSVLKCNCSYYIFRFNHSCFSINDNLPKNKKQRTNLLRQGRQYCLSKDILGH